MPRLIITFGIDKLKLAILDQTNFPDFKTYHHYIPAHIIESFNRYINSNSDSNSKTQISVGILIRYLEGDVLAKQLLRHHQNINLFFVDNCTLEQSWYIFFASQRHEFIKKHFISISI